MAYETAIRADLKGRTGWVLARMCALLLMVLTMVCAPAAVAQQAESAAKPRIAVLEFTGVDATAGEIAAVTDQVRNDLVKAERFEVLERTQIDAVLSEQALQQAGVTTEQAVEVGRLLNVEYIVNGRLIKPGPDAYQLGVQAIDVESGRIVASETARHQGSILGFLERLPPLTARAVARLFGEEPPHAPQRAQPARPTAEGPPPEPGLPITIRIFGSPLTILDLDIVAPNESTREEISAEGITLGYERFFTRNLSGGAIMHLGRVNEVKIPPAVGGPPQILDAGGTFNMVVLAGMYNWFPASWVLSAGGGFYFAALDYRFRDLLFSGGQETRWTVSATGLMFRFGADYVLPSRWFLGLGFNGDIVSSLSGSRIDEYNRHGGFDSALSTVVVVDFRAGYNF